MDNSDHPDASEIRLPIIGGEIKVGSEFNDYRVIDKYMDFNSLEWVIKLAKEKQ